MKRQSIGRTLILTFILGVGIAAVWAAVFGWSAIMVSQFNYKRPLRQSLSVRPDGTPIVISYVDYRDMTYESLDGKPITIDERENFLSGADFSAGERSNAFFLRKPWRQRIYPLSDGSKPEKYWYFVHDGRQNGAGYFVGFDRKTKERVGYIGTGGFAETQPPRSTWFPIDGRDFPTGHALLTHQYYRGIYEPDFYPSFLPAWRVQLRSGSSLIQVDLRERSVKTILEDPDLTAIGYLEIPPKTPENSHDVTTSSRQTLAARLRDRIVLLNVDGKQAGSYQIPEKLRNIKLTAYLVPGDQVLLVQSGPWNVEKRDIRLYWADREGKLLKERRISLAGYGAPTDASQGTWYASGLFPVPGILTPVLTAVAPLAEKDQGAPTYWQGMQRAIPKILPGLLAVNILGAVLAVLAVRRQQKFGLGRRKTWAVFVFLFGVAGYLAYLCHRHWPVREECGECLKPTPRDRDTCTFCNTPFPDPAPKGIEIFA